MKKLIIVFILLVASPLYAQEIYSFGGFSYLPMLDQNMYIPEGINFETNIGVGIEFHNLYVEVEIETDMVQGDVAYFSPYREKYYLRAGYVFWAIGVEYEHLCTHNVDWAGALYQYDKITINFDTRRLRGKL